MKIIRSQHYQLKFKNHFRLLKKQSFFLIIFLITIIYSTFSKYDGHEFIENCATVLTLIFFAPSAYLHLTYYDHDENLVLEIHENSLSVLFKEGNKMTITEENLIEIEFFMSPNFINYDTSFKGIPWEEYNYVLLTAKEGKVIITNLLFPKIKDVLKVFPKSKPVFTKNIFAQLP